MHPKLALTRIKSDMKNLEKSFKNIQDLSPSPMLADLILKKIEAKAQNEIRQKITSSYIYMFGSVCLFFYSFFAFGQSIIKSEFWSLVSLLFSDMQIVLSNWQEFVYSLLETFPLTATIAVLIPVVALLWSMAKYFDWHGKISQHMRIKKSFA